MPTLFVATNGLSIWTSTDRGATLARMPTSTGLYSGSRVWSLLETPRGLMAGTDSGIYLWDAAGARWTGLTSPNAVQMVTALAVSPGNPDVILAGAQPGALYRSEDAGRSWTKLDVSIKPYVSSGFFEDPRSIAAGTRAERPEARHWTRVTQIVFDARDPMLVWAGVEIGGAWRSRDGGVTWTACSNGLKSLDVHGFAVDGGASRTIFATTNDGLHRSSDGGENWTYQPIDSAWQYVRSIQKQEGGCGGMLLTNGNGAPGTEGRLFRSRDRGATWTIVPLPGSVESSLYFLATHRSMPDLVFAAATLGQLFRSDNGGESWTSLKQRLPEIRAIAWMP